MKTNFKNYLCINGKKTELTEEQLKQLGVIQELPVSLTEDGKIAKIGDYEFIVLKNDKTAETVELLLKNKLKDTKFGDTCDFKTSKVKEVLDDFSKEIESIVGADNLIEHTVDLTSDDGLKDYGRTKAKMSLLTCNQYREYVEIIDEHNLNQWWWLATPFSTPKHGYSELVKCVSPDGLISFSNGYDDYCGVRPFCVLKSNIFVSK